MQKTIFVDMLFQ